MLGGSSAQSRRGGRAAKRERAYRKEGKEGAEADQSPAEPKTVDERSRACVCRPCRFFNSS